MGRVCEDGRNVPNKPFWLEATLFLKPIFEDLQGPVQ